MGIHLQQSLEDAVVVDGHGIHSGKPARMFLRPSAPNTGIRFRRIDLPGRPEIPARIEHVTRTMLATTLGNKDAEVYTVEHVLSALFGMGINNAIVELDGPEVPIFDGSAGPFVKLIRNVGTCMQPAEKHVWVVNRPVRVEDGDKWIEIEPARTFSIDFTIEFADSVIGTQRLVYEHSPRRYELEISHARTFALAAEIETMRANGFALGGDFDNAVVVGDDGVLNTDGLRYPDEFVRHKILDLIGDVGMIGGPVVGAIRAHKSGHTLNRNFVKELIRSGIAQKAPMSDVGRRLRDTSTQHIQVISA